MTDRVFGIDAQTYRSLIHRQDVVTIGVEFLADPNVDGIAVPGQLQNYDHAPRVDGVFTI